MKIQRITFSPKERVIAVLVCGATDLFAYITFPAIPVWLESNRLTLTVATELQVTGFLLSCLVAGVSLAVAMGWEPRR